MKQLPATDQFGKSWIVYEVDTAWPHLKALNHKGVTEVVLPQDTFLTGNLPESLEGPNLDGLPLDAVEGEIKEIVRRTIRLNDCVQFLRLNPVEVAV